MAHDEGGASETTHLVGEGGVPRGAVYRWLCACFVSTFLSLEAMGYQALLPALYRVGLFDFLCDDDPAAANHTGTRSDTAARCDAQQAKLDLLFTLAYVGLNLATLPLAWLMYHYKPKYVSAAALVGKTVGYVLLALGTDGITTLGGGREWQYLTVVAFPLVASLGLVATLPFLNLPPVLFPAYVGLANSSLMGTADASSIWYYLLRQLHLHAETPLYVLFGCYAGVALLGSVLAAMVLAPLDSAKGASQTEHDKARGDAESGQHGDEEWVPLWRRMEWGKLALVCHWHVAFFVMKYFYMTNITSMAGWLTHGDADRTYALNTAFSIIMPCTGVLTPAVGWLQHKGMQASVLVNTAFAALLVVSSTVAWYPLQYVMLVCVATSRFLVFSILPTLCGLPQMFGVEGSVVFSLSSGVAGAVSTANYGLTVLARGQGSFFAINIMLGCWCAAATVPLVTYLRRHDVA